MTVIASTRRGTSGVVAVKHKGEGSIATDHFLRARHYRTPESTQHRVSVLSIQGPGTYDGEDVQTRAAVEDGLHEAEAQKTAISND